MLVNVNCPKCGERLCLGEIHISCSGRKNGCEFFAWKRVFGEILITGEVAKEIIDNEESKIFNVETRKGNKYRVKFRINEERTHIMTELM